jgi:hypothetical protein
MAKQTTKTKQTATKTITYESLNTWNRSLAVLHGAQGVLLLLLASSATFPVTANYLTQDSLASQAAGHPVLAAATRHLFDVNLAYLVVAFFFMSAIAHGLIATVYRKRYETDLSQGMNKARWIEYGISASTMIVAIALLTGVYDLGSLTMIFSLVLIMNLSGLMMEIHNQTTKKTNWLSYGIGCIAGIIPWLVIAGYLASAHAYGSGKIPTFVYWIYGSMFILFASFAVNMYLQYKKTGKWADYLYGERVYMILSLVAKSLLAWQVFFGALRP